MGAPASVGRNVSIQSGGVGITFGGVAALGVTTTTIVGGTPSSQQSNASPAASKTAKTASLKGASLAALLSDESIFNRFGP